MTGGEVVRYRWKGQITMINRCNQSMSSVVKMIKFEHVWHIPPACFFFVFYPDGVYIYIYILYILYFPPVCLFGCLSVCLFVFVYPDVCFCFRGLSISSTLPFLHEHSDAIRPGTALKAAVMAGGSWPSLRDGHSFLQTQQTMVDDGVGHETTLVGYIWDVLGQDGGLGY